MLGDVVALANASGGTLLYGAVEGEGTDRGRIVGLQALSLTKDREEGTVANLLRDAVDERIPGVLHRAIPYEHGFLYLIRVPMSPLAPHMVTLKSSRPRFFMRGTISNDPMNARQIKEVALRLTSAEDRVRALIDARTEVLRKRSAARAEYYRRAGRSDHAGGDQILVHIVPLYPVPGGINFAEDSIRARLAEVHPFGSGRRGDFERMQLEGFSLAQGESDELPLRSALHLRSGGIEFQRYDVVEAGIAGRRVIYVQSLEEGVLDSLDAARGLVEAGLLSMPVVGRGRNGPSPVKARAAPRSDPSERC